MRIISSFKTKFTGKVIIAVASLCFPLMAEDNAVAVTNGAGEAQGMTVEVSQKIKEALESPDMKDMMQKKIDEQFNQIWNPFLTQISDSGKRDQFVAKMLESSRASSDSAMNIVKTGVVDPQAIADMVNGHRNLDTEISSILGIEDYAKYQEYKKSVSSRQMLVSLETSGFKVADPAKTEQLVGMIGEAQQKIGLDCVANPFAWVDAFKEKTSSILDENEKASLDTAVSNLTRFLPANLQGK